jgi:hypothetical protein
MRRCAAFVWGATRALRTAAAKMEARTAIVQRLRSRGCFLNVCRFMNTEEVAKRELSSVLVSIGVKGRAVFDVVHPIEG